MKAYGVVLAGGGGTRFWPLSRQSRPKQLLNLTGRNLMINETIDRLNSIIHNENIYIVTSEQQVEKICEAIDGRVLEDHILCEPAARNTAACIGYAAIEIAKRHGDGIMCVFPADHYIACDDAFHKVVAEAIQYAETTDKLVTIGVKPTFPATGYGYIRFECGTQAAKRVLEFKEKPDMETAKAYVSSGNYLWNSGMFVWKASVIIKEFKLLQPDIHRDLMKIYEAIGTKNEKKVLHNVYPAIRKISIDYSIMEKSQNVIVIPAEFGWNDIGSWDMMKILRQKDENGNIVMGDVHCINTSNAVVYSSTRHISVVDMEDVVIVETPDAIMVCRQASAQNVKLAVEKLGEENRDELL